MHLMLLVLLSLTNQLALGSPLIFPDEVNVYRDAVWRLNTMESKLESNKSSLGITNISAKMEQDHTAYNTSEIEIKMSDQGEDYLGNKQTNETDLLYLIEDNYPDFMNNGSNKISSDNRPKKKSMEIRAHSVLNASSENSAVIALYRNMKRRSTGKQIFFPNTRNPVDSSPIPGSGNIPNSPIIGPCRDGYIRFQGVCSRLLSSKPCGENLWLVMKSDDFAECELRPCPLGQIFHLNACVYPEASNICAEGQILYVELTGESFCDCESNYFYNVLDGTCVPEHEQGWCNWGEYIVQNEDGIPACFTNPCGRDGFAYLEKYKWCYRKNYVGLCEQKHINIIGDKAECNEAAADLRNIFEVPTLRRCPRGSLRDILHECRRRFNVPSIPSVLKYKQFNGGCSAGFTKGPRGCKKIVNLFANSGRRS